jgi:hypothetical protein
VKAKISGKGGNTTRTDRKKKAKIPISVNPKIQFTWREKIQGTKGRSRNIITQARVNRSRYEWDEGNYEDEEKQMGERRYPKVLSYRTTS